VALVGNLKDLALPNLVQLNCMEKNISKLSIKYRDKVGIVFFEDGQICHAEFDGVIGEEAIYKLLTLSEGEFKVESGVKAPTKTIQANWSNLLLEGMRLVDESKEAIDAAIQKLAKDLSNISGIKAVLVAFGDGRVVTHSHQDNENKNAALSSFALEKTRALSHALEWSDNIRQIILTQKDEKQLIFKYDPYNICLTVDVKTPVETISSMVEKVLKRM
jgi:predicted regulator of Ras-like GTPase activity (Roadblock/LC7/MglB family)